MNSRLTGSRTRVRRAMFWAYSYRWLTSRDTPLADVGTLAEWALPRGIDLPDLDVRRPSLEDVYLQLTGAAG